MPTDPLALYVHVPFCGVRCSYCAFNVVTHREAQIPRFVDAVRNELRWLGTGPADSALADAALGGVAIHTIYLGGGSPSLLTTGQVDAILGTIRSAFAVTPGAEISIEINPDSLPDDYLDRLRATGVNRLSVGMQSAHADELRLFTRQHTPADVGRVMRLARAAGFENINLDLIYGIPGQTLARWNATLEAALALAPDHLSLYALQVEEKTALAHWIARGDVPTPDDDLAADMYDLADTLTAAAGLCQYEISNWARPGQECRHNLHYWRNLPYLGVGPGAHGYAAGQRYEVIRSLGRYIETALRIDSPPSFPITPTVENWEKIDIRSQMAEHMITGLRLLKEGVSAAGFQERFGVSLHARFGPAIAKLTADGLLDERDGTLRLTRAARLVSNRVFVEFVD